MENLTKAIKIQLEYNRDQNICYPNNKLAFSSSIVKYFQKLGKLTEGEETYLVNFTTEKTLNKLYAVNQYYYFTSKNVVELRGIYKSLLKNIKNNTTNSVQSIEKNHFKKLKEWLVKSNPFVTKIYTKPKVDGVACSEYTANTQLKVLQINLQTLVEPILDIGCGENAIMVHYLKEQGFDVQGIDRYNFKTSYLSTADWLNYKYKLDYWGTIISHLAFTNHFTHHHLRTDGNYIKYAKTFMKIINSLKSKGSFHYTPHLPFIEKYLDNNKFTITHNKVNQDYSATTIVKL